MGQRDFLAECVCVGGGGWVGSLGVIIRNFRGSWWVRYFRLMVLLDMMVTT